MQGHHAEITAVLFVDPYPLLITADCAGFIMFWCVVLWKVHEARQARRAHPTHMLHGASTGACGAATSTS